MVLSIQVVHAQLKTVTGIIKDDKGEPVPGATVKAKGSNEATTTGADGSFSFSVPESTTSLVVSGSGFGERTVSVNNAGNIVLRHVAQQLDTVVVQTGVGTTRRLRDVTGAISHVSGNAIKNLPTQDVATALQGRVAGVEVVSPSGEPGQTSQITIRGVSSLNNANPLYVVDGVIQYNSGGNNINPNDIESIDVLKDASAAAIYGSAAAGGVIIITTKRGKTAKPTVSFNARYGVAKPKTIGLLDASDFVRYQKDIKNPDYTNPANATLISSLTPVDWDKELYRNGKEQNYSLSISGTTPTVNYYLSGVYDDQQGVFLDNQSSMAGARINTDITLSKRIKIGEQLNVWTRNTVPVKTPIVSTPFESQPFLEGGVPYSSVPGTLWGIYPFGYHGGINAVSQIKTANFQFPENNFDGQVYLEIKLPIKYLTFKSTFGYTSQTYENNLFQNVYATNGTPLTFNGTLENHLYRNVGNYQQELNAYILAYDHSWGKHTLNLLAGYEQYAHQTQNVSMLLQNVLGTSFAVFPSSSTLASGGQSVSGGYDPNGLVKSVFGRLNYDFNKKYYVTATVRRDGNFTVFGQDNQYGVFPAVSAGWNIDQERFFTKLSSIFSQLKLRASYGELGNSNIGDYNFATYYVPATVQNFTPGGAAQVSYTQQSIANENVQWESTKETNIGIDGQALNGKLYFNIDWYNKNTTKLLYNVPVSLSSGVPYGGAGFTGGAVNAGTYIENIGSVRNRGVDIAIGYNGKQGQLTYSAGVTGSFNANKVLNIVTADGLPDGNNNFPYGTSVWSGQTLTRTYPGSPFGQFWGLKSEGIIQNSTQQALAISRGFSNARIGDLLYASDTAGKIGNPYPKFTYGINLNAAWKGFDIALLFNGVMGVQLYNGVTPYEFENLDGSNVTSKVFQTSGFTDNGVSNGVTKYPSVGRINGFGQFTQDPNGNYTTPSSYFVENGSYLKLKNIQIGYTLSNKILEKVKIKSLRIYVMANNLFTITKYTGVDPEIGSQYAILGLDKNGNVTGNADGTPQYTGSATTSRGIDGPSKYPSVKLYAIGVNVVF